MTGKIVDFVGNQAYQGDVPIVKLDAKYSSALKRNYEMIERDGRLILAEGELTGHHHHIKTETTFSAEQTAGLIAKSLAKSKAKAALKQDVTSARMYKDSELVARLVKDGVLLRDDLAIGFLEVTGDSVVVEHQEHDGIRLPTGLYYIGSQVESAGAEERKVAD